MRTLPIRKMGRLAVAAGCGMLLVWICMIIYAVVDLAAQVRTVKSLAASGLDSADVAVATTVLHRVRRDVVVLRQQAGWLVAGTAHLQWLPTIGPVLGQGPALMELGDSLTELAVLLWADVSPSLIHRQHGETWRGLLPDVLSAVARDLDQKQDLANRAVVAYAGLDTAALPSVAGKYVDLLGALLPLVADGLAVTPVAPGLLGYDSPRTYLVLALNEDELRPGGGFITGVGEVQVAAGDVVSMEFRDSYEVDDFTLPYPDAPEPLRQFLGGDLWVFRDSNWSPDFPTAARQALELYRSDAGTGATADGVISIDQRGVQLLLEGLGPLGVRGISGMVTADTVIDYMHEAWAPDDGVLDAEWFRQRKSFMGDLAVGALERLRRADFDLSVLGRQALAALDQRHIQVYIREPGMAQLMAQRHWDGALGSPSTDFLALVEANLGYNKASRNIDRSIAYEVDLRESQPRVQVTLRLTHLSDVEIPCTPESRYDVDYEAMTHRCYWAHLRLFVQPGAVLLGATPSPIPANLMFRREAWLGEAIVSDDLGHTVFSQAVLLPTAGERELRFAFLLPAETVRREPDGSFIYRLTLRKQAGIERIAGTMTLLMPQNAVAWGDGVALQTEQVGVVTWSFSSSTDLTLAVHYRLPEGVD